MKTPKGLSLGEREAFYDDLERRLLAGEVTIAEAIRSLRVDLLGVDQETFARIGRISARTLKSIEAGRGNPTIATLNGLLTPFGFRVGVVRERRS